MDGRVRNHVKDIKRSLEKICDIIDWGAGNTEVPDFLRLLPMRYRAGDCLIELTAMNKWDYQAMNKFEVSEISGALQSALKSAAGISDAVRRASFNEGLLQSPISYDDDVFQSIMAKMVSSIDVPSLDKTTLDCISICLRKELQELIDSKLDAAKASLTGLEDGRTTRSRSRSSRSYSPQTLTPSSSTNDHHSAWQLRPKPCDGNSRYEAIWGGCDNCRDHRPQDTQSETSTIEQEEACEYPIAGRWPSTPHHWNTSSNLRVYSPRPWSPKLLPRVSQPNKSPLRRRASKAYSRPESPIVRRVQAVSLEGDWDSESVGQVPELKTYTAMTSSSISSQRTAPATNIVDMHIEDVWNGGHYSRRGKVTWSNGSTEVNWMDGLSKKYPQQLIQYYEKTLLLENNVQCRQNPQLWSQAVPTFNTAHSNTSEYAMHMPQGSQVQYPIQHSAQYPVHNSIPRTFGLYGNESNDNTTGGWGWEIPLQKREHWGAVNASQHSTRGSFGTPGNTKSNTKLRDNRYDADPW